MAEEVEVDEADMDGEMGEDMAGEDMAGEGEDDFEGERNLSGGLLPGDVLGIGTG